MSKDISSEILQEPTVLSLVKGELFFARALKNFAQQLQDVNLPNVNLQKEIAAIENLRKSFLQDRFYKILVYLTLNSLDCITCEDTAIEKAEAALQKIIKEMPMAGQYNGITSMRHVLRPPLQPPAAFSAAPFSSTTYKKSHSKK